MTHQPTLPGIEQTTHIVNVASVPQRSPFRYPGGKTWLIPYIRTWLLNLQTKPNELIEPFAGGAIVGLTSIFERLVKHVTLIELDEQVAAVWQTILSDDATWLANRIVEFRLDPANVEALFGLREPSRRERALQTIVKNRVNHGGILAPGAGQLKHGEGGKGIASRWYPDTLKSRILQIAAIRDNITFIHDDGLQVMREQSSRTDAVFFIDPPYTASQKKPGNRLYTHFDLDHEELFDYTQTLSGDFLMTYDNAEEVDRLAKAHGFDTKAIAMKNTHHAKMTELLVARDLKWIR